MPTLADLKKNQEARIKELQPSECATRLLALGCVPGSKVRFQYTAPLGDPICVAVNGSLLAMRKSEAATIVVESN